MSIPPDFLCGSRFVRISNGIAFLLLVLVFSVANITQVRADEPLTAKRVAPKVQKRAMQPVGSTKSGDISVSTPNPYLSYLPAESVPDYANWKARMQFTSAQRREQQLQAAAASGLAQFVINQNEVEPVGVKGMNDSPLLGVAEAVPGFGSGTGEDGAADISGDLRGTGSATEFFPNAEDDGDINKASISGLVDQDAVIATSLIGDGPFGSASMTLLPTGIDTEDDGAIPLANATGLTLDSVFFENAQIGDGTQGSTGTATGDFDLYSFTMATPATVFIDVLRDVGETQFRPIVGLYSPDGTLQLSFDDLVSPGEIFLAIDLPAGTWYVAIGGNVTLDGDPSDEFLGDANNSDSGPGVGSEGSYELVLTEPVSGDFDFYQFTANESDAVTIEVDTDPYGGQLDPIVAVFDSAGVLISFNDDGGQSGEPFDSFLTLTIPLSGTYYAAVGGFSIFPTAPDSFPTDAFDSSTGPGFGSEGDYDVILSRNADDVDFYSFELDAGDIFAANTFGGAQVILFYDDSGTLLNGSFSDISGIFPPSTGLPGGGVASTAYIVNTAGTYFAGVFLGEGPYTLELRSLRPPQEASRTTQKLFLDFDGETLDTRIFGSSGFETAVLSPLSAFLPGWGLLPADEDAVIDAILAEVRRALDADLRANGLNDAFDIEILNSRDHADMFGDPDVSRIIIGGTIAESGIDTIGIAQSIDIGNFDQSETALVLLDLLGDPDPGNSNSLNSFPVDPGASKIDLIGAGVGNVTSHEAGHFFANFHTDNANVDTNLMDTGGNLGNLVGVGGDGTWGTGDDESVVFGPDAYDPFEGFIGVEDTRNSIAFALMGTPGGPRCSAAPLPVICAMSDINGDGQPDVSAAIPGSVDVYVRDGVTDADINDIAFGSDPGIAVEMINDLDGNDAPEVAVLSLRPSGQVVVTVRDSLTDAVINTIFYGAAYSPLDMAVLPDSDGNGAPEFVVLGVDAGNGIRAQARDALTDAATSTTFYGANATAIDVQVIPDINGNGAPEIAMHARVNASSQGRVQFRDSMTGAFIRQAFFGIVYVPQQIAVIDDITGDGIPELAQLARRDDTGAVRIQVKNPVDGATVSNAFTGDTDRPVDIVGTGGMVGMLVEDAGGVAKVIKRDALTGAFIGNVFMGAIGVPEALVVLDDLDGSGDPEYAALGDNAGQRVIQIKDTVSGAQINNINVP